LIIWVKRQPSIAGLFTYGAIKVIYEASNRKGSMQWLKVMRGELIQERYKNLLIKEIVKGFINN
jgi:hypothetical protein